MTFVSSSATDNDLWPLASIRKREGVGIRYVLLTLTCGRSGMCSTHKEESLPD